MFGVLLSCRLRGITHHSAGLDAWFSHAIWQILQFFETAQERIAAGDPRPSLEERYPTHAVYVDKVTAAANQLVRQRLLLPQDAALIISQANAAAVP